MKINNKRVGGEGRRAGCDSNMMLYRESPYHTLCLPRRLSYVHFVQSLLCWVGIEIPLDVTKYPQILVEPCLLDHFFY
jgi:hypothetical protein